MTPSAFDKQSPLGVGPQANVRDFGSIAEVNTYTMDRHYAELQQMIEKEVRSRMESERIFRENSRTQQETITKLQDEVAELSLELNSKIPKFEQDNVEIRRAHNKFSNLYCENLIEMRKLKEQMEEHCNDVRLDLASMERIFREHEQKVASDKAHMWENLANREVMESIGERVGMLDVEVSNKIVELRTKNVDMITVLDKLEEKISTNMGEFETGIRKCDLVVAQSIELSSDLRQREDIIQENCKQLIEQVLISRIDKCEDMVRKEMKDRVVSVKKIAHELVNTKEQQDQMLTSLDRCALETNADRKSVV